MAGAIGNNDPRVSNYRKCWLQGDDGQTICGIYGPGTSREITANWISPFEGESLGDKMGMAGSLAQTFGDMTSVATMTSRQNWKGNQPTSITLELQLYALQDPVTEVMLPLKLIETWMAPDVGSGFFTLGGLLPNKVVLLNIGTKVIYTDLIINSMSHPLDKEVDSRGNFVRATVNLQFSTLTMVSKDMLKSGKYGVMS